LGTHIYNSASIYFDFNAPIRTKQTLNTIAWGAGVQNTTAATTNNSFTIYPNPANNSFNAILDLTAGGTYNLNISDVTGKTEISKVLNLQKGNQSVTIDAGQLAPGVYFVTFSGSDSKAQTQKLVIIK
jgi:hypothetical protein